MTNISVNNLYRWSLGKSRQRCVAYTIQIPLTLEQRGSDLVCFGVFVLLENVSLILRRHNYRWRAGHFYLDFVLMAIEQWRFFSVPHLLWHGASVYNGHLSGPVTQTCCLPLSSGAFTTCFNDFGLYRLRMKIRC